MKTPIVPLLGLFLLAVVRADEPHTPLTETTAGWVKYSKNPVLGGPLGTQAFTARVIERLLAP